MAAEGETQPLLAEARGPGNESPSSSNHNGDGHEAILTTAANDAENGNSGPRSAFSKTLGTAEAFAIIISIVIGSGIFTSPGSIDTNVPSPGAALIIWLIGGVLAWTGASTMAELGTAIPGEGGVQPYLAYIFGDVFGFLAAWTWIVAVMPATLAILSIVFVESIYSAAGITGDAGRVEHKLLSILILVLVSVANSVSTKTSTRLNGFFVVTKFTAIVAVVLAGVVVLGIQATDPEREDVGGRDWFVRNWFANRPSVNPDGSETDWDDISQWELLGHYSAALYGALWAYSGWDKAIYISAELSKPAKQLPLAINSAIPTIILCFITANAAYYILLPWNVVSTTDSVAVTAITRLLGRGLGIVAAAVICLVVAGSLLGNSFVAGRMAVAAANQDWFPRVFARLGRVGFGKSATAESESESQSEAGTEAETETETEIGEANADSSAAPAPTISEPESTSDAPINAIILSALLSALYILLGNFRALLTFNGLGEYSFFFLTVLGAIVLRVREPASQLPRPYQPPILVPAIFAIVSGFVVVRGAIFAPVLAAVLVVLWGVGGVVYWVRGMVRRRGRWGGIADW
ncbi:amino acid/polyamine transporter I [Nemania sp. FL0916]|nr:amino acid/polyamine transporter I [Nemania sp. FL0916]